MIEKITEQINSFLSTLKTTYSQQGRVGKILLPALFLLTSCCLCSVLISLLRLGSRNPANSVPSPIILPSQGIVASPTALFNFGTVTFIPIPTFPTATGFPTLTPLPSLPTGTETPTSTPTQIPPTGTEIPLPLPTVTSPPPATPTIGGSVLIVAVDKPMEYVDIQNLMNAPVDLQGWRLVSETGNQSCTLRGVLQPNEVLRVWASAGNPGISCGYSFNIWNDNQSDPAVLYDAQGQEISRVP
jgi:Predicted solute binding protein